MMAAGLARHTLLSACCLAALLVLHCLAVGAPMPAAPDHPLSTDDSLNLYHLVWHDEFQGDALNTDSWNYRTDSKLWSKQLPGNVSVSDGALHLALRHEHSKKMAYTGGGIISRRAFEYGYYEACFRCPPGSGWHTSFWTMKHDQHGDTQPAKTQEIDICEQDSVDLHQYSAGVIAWGNAGTAIGRKYVSPDLAGGNLSTDFHVWGCEFTPERVRFYFDGKMTHEASSEKFTKGEQEIWLTCIATPFGNTKFVDVKKLPATADFKYVRFFQRPGTPTTQPQFGISG